VLVSNVEGSNEGSDIEGSNVLVSNVDGSNEGSDTEGSNAEGSNVEGSHVLVSNVEGSNEGSDIAGEKVGDRQSNIDSNKSEATAGNYDDDTGIKFVKSFLSFT
jgi:hypothetical protein